MSLFDMSDAVDALASGNYTVRRRAAATFDSHGRAVAGAETVLSVRASVSPLSARERQLLPEGIRTKETLQVFSSAELRTDDSPAGIVADRLEYEGETYVVSSVERWAALGNFYKSIVVRTDT